jgi:tetratricopeptide (TPR) repeat protein
MRTIIAVIPAVVAALVIGPGPARTWGPAPAHAAENPGTDEARPAAPANPGPKLPPRAASLDELFARLSETKDESEAKGIVASIERRWMRSGSDTADLLMNRALDALKAGDQALSVELLDRVVTLRPEWAEGWNKRATVFFMMGDMTRSMADIREVLAREPRHFGALAGMGIIMQSTGDTKHAYEAFKKALAVNPFLPDVKSAVEKMAPEMDGQDI